MHAIPMEKIVSLTVNNVLKGIYALLILLKLLVTMVEQMAFVNSFQPQILAD